MNQSSISLAQLAFAIGGYVFRREFSPQYREIQQNMKLSASQQEILSGKRLEQMLLYAQKHCTFYKNQIPESWDNPFEALAQLPILTKQMIKDHYQDLLIHTQKEKEYQASTGGTTQNQLKVTLFQRDRDRNLAQQLLLWQSGGFQIGKASLQIGATQRNLIRYFKDFLFNITYAHINTLHEEQLLVYLKQIQQKKYKQLIAYPSRLKQLVGLAQKHHIKDLKLDLIITLGDKLMDEDQQMIQEIFQCKVVETYGATEGFIIGAAADDHSLPILWTDFMVEILNQDNQPCKVGELGRIVLSNLISKKMPLIRYEIGDIGYWVADETVAFGKKLRVEGRTSDWLHNFKGSPVTTRKIYSLLYTKFRIYHFLLTPTAHHQYKLSYLSTEMLKGVTLQRIKQILKYEFNLDIHHIDRLDEIPRYASGKPKYIESVSSSQH